MDTPIGARESVRINELMTPIFKASKPVNRNTFMTPTFNAGKPVDMKNLKRPSFDRKVSFGPAPRLQKEAKERDGLPVFKVQKRKQINNLMTPGFACGVSDRVAPFFKKKFKVNSGVINKPPNSLQGGWGRKRTFTSAVNPSSSSTLETADNWFTTPKTQKMDIDFPRGEITFPRNETIKQDAKFPATPKNLPEGRMHARRGTTAQTDVYKY